MPRVTVQGSAGRYILQQVEHQLFDTARLIADRRQAIFEFVELHHTHRVTRPDCLMDATVTGAAGRTDSIASAAGGHCSVDSQAAGGHARTDSQAAGRTDSRQGGQCG